MATINDNLFTAAPKALDEKFGPFATILNAQSAVDVPFRYQGLTQSIIIGGKSVPHHYRDGTSNNQLIPTNYSLEESETSYLDPIQSVFKDAANSLPTTTATAVDGRTIENNDRVLVLDSTTASQKNKIYIATVTGGSISWAEEDGGAGPNGQSGDTTWAQYGTTYENQRFNYDGTNWEPQPIEGSPLPSTNLTFGYLGNFGAQNYFYPQNWISVKAYYADTAAFNAGYNSNIGESCFVFSEKKVYQTVKTGVTTVTDLTLQTNIDPTVFVQDNLTLYYLDGSNNVLSLILDSDWKGAFDDETDLTTAYPNGIGTPSDRAGWRAWNEDTNTIWGWDVDTNAWVNTGSASIPIVDNLTSTSTTSALSANQGKVLNEAKAEKAIIDASFVNIGAATTCNFDSNTDSRNTINIKKYSISATGTLTIGTAPEGQRNIIQVKTSGSGYVLTLAGASSMYEADIVIDDSTTDKVWLIEVFNLNGSKKYSWLPDLT